MGIAIFDIMATCGGIIGGIIGAVSLYVASRCGDD